MTGAGLRRNYRCIVSFRQCASLRNKTSKWIEQCVCLRLRLVKCFCSFIHYARGTRRRSAIHNTLARGGEPSCVATVYGECIMCTKKRNNRRNNPADQFARHYPKRTCCCSLEKKKVLSISAFYSSRVPT